MTQHMRYFYGSLATAFIGLALAFWWGGAHGLLIALLLVALEIGFSFDNAVVNATVLHDMDAVWQKRFLTWGMVVCVFGMYYLFPLLIVSIASGLGLFETARLAIADPAAYGAHIAHAHTTIVAFGGMFLLMVFFNFLFDEARERHWLGEIERCLARLGQLKSIAAATALVILLVLQRLLPEAERASVVVAGVGGVTLYIVVHGITALLSLGEKTAARAGLAGFLYLQVLDASFSLDAVVGAFALSTDIVIILLGLTIGAMFVRSLTIYLVHQGTLARYVYLEHGAYYAIGALAFIMLAETRVDVPDVVTGLIGIVLIALSLFSSIRQLKR